jgi:hypothetical protein
VHQPQQLQALPAGMQESSSMSVQVNDYVHLAREIVSGFAPVPIRFVPDSVQSPFSCNTQVVWYR